MRAEGEAAAEWIEQRTGVFARAVDFRADGLLAVAVDEDGSLWSVGFAGPAERLASSVVVARWFAHNVVIYATDSGELRRLELPAGTSSTVAAADAIAEMVVPPYSLGPGGEAFLVAARGGQVGLWELDLASGEWQLLLPASDIEEIGHLSVAPGSESLVFEHGIDGLTAWDLGGEEVRSHPRFVELTNYIWDALRGMIVRESEKAA